MAMRLIIGFALLAVSLTGCLKNTADEYAAMETEPVVTEKTSVITADVNQASQGKSVSVEPVASQAVAIEKPSVQNIQQALKNAALYEGKIDGVLGPNTKKAIESFQSNNGLKADGKVGSKTWQKLKEYLVK